MSVSSAPDRAFGTPRSCRVFSVPLATTLEALANAGLRPAVAKRFRELPWNSPAQTGLSEHLFKRRALLAAIEVAEHAVDDGVGRADEMLLIDFHQEASDSASPAELLDVRRVE